MKQFIIQSNDADQRLDKFIAQCFVVFPDFFAIKWVGVFWKIRIVIGDDLHAVIDDHRALAADEVIERDHRTIWPARSDDD